MAFDDTPSTWITGILQKTADGSGNITGAANAGKYLLLPIDSGAHFDKITTAEANETTGDIRKIIFGISDGLYEAWNAIATADRPAKMTLTKGTSSNATTGVFTRTFSFQFNTEVSGEEVVAE